MRSPGACGPRRHCQAFPPHATSSRTPGRRCASGSWERGEPRRGRGRGPRGTGATIRFHDLVEGDFTVGGFRVAAQYLNHPALTLGYRLEADGAAVVYAVDHEPHLREGPEAAGLLSRVEGAGPVHPEDRRHIAFLAGADLVIHDA